MGMGVTTTIFLLLMSIWIGPLSLAAGLIASSAYDRRG